MNIQQVIYSTSLDTREITHGIYELLNPLIVLILIDGEWYECDIPAGFFTDFCSVPRVPFAFMFFGGKYNRTGTLHDALYSDWRKIQIVHLTKRFYIPISKDMADAILFKSLREEGANYLTASFMHKGVVMFGNKFYKRN